MSKSKREAMLLDVQPRLCRRKWPALRRAYGSDDTTTVDPEMAGLLPYLNIKTLKEDSMRLICLMHLRGNYDVVDWIMLDVQQLRHGWTIGLLRHYQYNENSVTMTDIDDAYGYLREYNSNVNHTWVTIGYPLALQVFQAHSLLFSFLAGMARQLHSPNSTREGHVEWTRVVTSGFKATGRVECWSSFSNQVFSMPQTQGMGIEKAIPLDHMQAIMDHLELLQTDPFYMHDAIRRSLRCPTSGSYAASTSEHEWQEIITDVLIPALRDVEHVYFLTKEHSHLRGLLKQIMNGPEPNLQMSLQMRDAMIALHYMCKQLYSEKRKGLLKTLQRCPDFAHNYGWSKGPDGVTTPGRLTRNLAQGNGKNRDRNLFRLDPLHWALEWLTFEDVSDLPGLDVPQLYAFIDDHLANASRAEQSRMSQGLYDQLATMSIFARVDQALNIDRIAPACELDPANISPAMKTREAWRYLHRAQPELTLDETTLLIPQLKQFYKTPLPSGTHDIQSRDALSNFWRAAGKAIGEAYIRVGYSSSDTEVLVLGPLSRADSAECKAERQAEEQALTQKVAEQLKAYVEQHLPVQPVQTTWGEQHEEKAIPAKERQKPKSRPRSLEDDPHTSIAGALESLAVHNNHQQPQLAVNTNSLRILQNLYPTFAGYGSGSVRWQEFVTAMADAGFCATQIGGSAVSFTPVRVPNAKGSIVFHKPHPDPTIDPIVLRIMGKRMSKWFGWDRDSFVERQKAVPNPED